MLFASLNYSRIRQTVCGQVLQSCYHPPCPALVVPRREWRCVPASAAPPNDWDRLPNQALIAARASDRRGCPADRGSPRGCSCHEGHPGRAAVCRQGTTAPRRHCRLAPPWGRCGCSCRCQSARALRRHFWKIRRRCGRIRQRGSRRRRCRRARSALVPCYQGRPVNCKYSSRTGMTVDLPYLCTVAVVGHDEN